MGSGVAAVLALAGGAFLLARDTAPAAPVVVEAPVQAPAPPAPPPRPPEATRATARLVGRNQNPTQVLAGLGLEGAELQGVLAALEGALSFKRIRPGDQVRIERDAAGGALRSLSWRQGPADEYIV
ncbi:MAG: M23 family peptidase, partial [Anaeromyxobacteraceae bacterium]